jgi:competence protein ComEA
MLWLYHLQQRLAITRRESLALLTLTSLFLVGWTVQHVQEQHVPPVDAAPLTAAAVDAEAVAQEASPAARGPVNVNTASAAELQTLSGIGPALSQRIIDYRTAHRPFERADELQRVRGIGPKTLEALRARITVTTRPDADTLEVAAASGSGSMP